MSSAIGKQGRVIVAQTREVVYNVFAYFKNREPNMTTKELKEIVHLATKVSISSINKIIQEGNNADIDEQGNKVLKFATPGTKRTKKKPVVDIDDVDQYDFRRVIYNFHKTENCHVTLKHLLAKLKSEFNFQGGKSSLGKIVKKLGFRWRKSKNNRRLLIEHQDIRYRRIAFLKGLKKYREQKRPIIYLDESYVHSSHTVSKSWNDNTSNGLMCPISKGQRLIMVHAGGEMGFVNDALLIFKSGSKSGDYHDDMNSSNYDKWVRDKLLPNLPPQSVVVIDNAPYHNVQECKAPSSNSRKEEMKQWLSEKNIAFASSLLKPQLYELIKLHKKQHIVYKFDNLLAQHGHTVLRLPPYHPELNPIELIWGKVKNSVAAKNTTFKLEDIRKLLEAEFEAVDSNYWKKCCSKVVAIEDEYLKNEISTDIVTEELIIHLGSSSSSNSESDEDESESD